MQIALLPFRREYSEIASHCFLHCDLVGQHFMCYMLSRTGKLQMLRLDGLKGVHKNGVIASIPARDAVALQVICRWLNADAPMQNNLSHFSK